MSPAELRVVIVHLRRPRRNDPNETRADPYWEVGSFGCTGCHRRNLMHPGRATELNGSRLAFAQGGALGFRLIYLTPPVEIFPLQGRCEAIWKPAELPFRYDAAPLLIDNEGNTSFPRLREQIDGGGRSTWEGKFSSRFRSRRKPLDAMVARELAAIFDRLWRHAPADSRACTYVDAIPFPPPRIQNDRRADYTELLGRIDERPVPVGPKPRRNLKRTERRC